LKVQVPRHWQRWLAAFPPAAIGTLILAQALTPSGLDQPIRSLDGARAALADASSQSTRLYLCTTLIILGVGLLAVAFCATATLCVGRGGARLAATSVGLAWLACVSGVVVNSLVNLNVAGAVRADASTDAAAQVLFTVNTTPTPTAFLVCYIGGLLAAGLVMGVALWRADSVQKWLPVMFPVTLVIASLAPSGPVGALVSVPFAIVMVALARQVWRASTATTRSDGAS
jgi:hypothetical protein